MIEREGASTALVIFSGVQYFSGQSFDMKAITAAARAKVGAPFFLTIRVPLM